MRRLATVLLTLVLLWGASAPAMAVFPAPWPDNGNADVNTGWIPYTYGGQPPKDKEGGADPSTGGTTPQQEADVVSDAQTRTSIYYAYDAANQVLFFRFRLGNGPFTSTPNGSSNDDPLTPVQWNVLIDTDGDGFKEFIVSLNGDSGGPALPLDRLYVYYENIASQAIPASFLSQTVAGQYPDADARTTVTDLKNVREIEPALTGGSSYFLDFQVPLSVFNVGGNQLITPTTPIAFGYATANSNVNPFQKDAVYDGAFTADINQPFPFGDNLTPLGGITQDPIIFQVTTNCTRPTDLLQARVRDVLLVNGGAATSTVASVKFYYQPDADGNGTPDVGSSPVLIGEVTTPSPGTLDLFEFAWDTSAGPPGGTYDIFATATDIQGNTVSSAKVVCTLDPLPGVAVSGTVYEDANHDALKQSGETGAGVSGMYVKLAPTGGGSATAAASVDAASGVYTLPAVAAGTYLLILDTNNTLSDVTPGYPSGYIGTEVPTGQRTVTVAATPVTGQNFGLWHGSRLSGSVFLDDGSGGGTANDGIRQGGEAGIAGAAVKALNGATTLDQATTDGTGAYRLYLPFSAGGATLNIAETNPPNYESVGGSPGTTGGAYTLATDRTTFTYVAATAAYTGVDFADVPTSVFLQDNQAQGAPGDIVFHPHRFTAGTAGTVTFTQVRTSTPALPNWASTLYRDLNDNGVVDAGEPVVSGGVALAGGQQLALILKEYIPPNAPLGAQDQVALTATFQPANTALQIQLTRVDLTTVTGSSGVTLRKVVDLTTATSGTVLTYTITYSNRGEEPITNLVVRDKTPAYTTFVAAANGALPTGLTGVTIAGPGVGLEGPVTWTFTGNLAPGAQGTVTFQVQVK